MPEYYEDDRRDLEVRETRRHSHLSDSQIVLVKVNKQPMDKLKVFTGKMIDNFRV
jgi:polynucleotide 5'-kinase involved in rRNA processing